MSTLLAIAVIWLFLSFGVYGLEAFAFFLWLRSEGVPVRFSLAGAPGYLSSRYLAWCRQHGYRPDAKRLRARRIVSRNLAAAIVFAALAIGGKCVQLGIER